MSESNILVTVTGPSLTGKSTFASLLKPHGFEELVSTTTRPPRVGEIPGVHYNFVTKEQFQEMERNKLMIEKVSVNDYHYGLSKPAFEAVIAKGNNGIAVVEPHGAQQVAAYCEENGILLHQIFVNNPQELLVQRFLQRYKADNLAKDEVYAKRLIHLLHVEPEKWIKPAYDGRHHYHQIFDSFTPENQENLIQEVLQAVDSKLNRKAALKKRMG